MSEWVATTYEDRLLKEYLQDHPGELFLEVAVGLGGEGRGPRRIDGVLIPGHEPTVHPQDSYSSRQIAARLRGNVVHLLEAKRVLNRNVIGQVQVGEALLRRQYDVDGVVPVAVCGGGNPDLAWYCGEKGVEAVIYPHITPTGGKGRGRVAAGRRDVRSDPDPARKKAFLRGWNAAVEGRLYGSVRRRITHTNIGNLFGWIYGQQPEEFREATWDRYVERLQHDESLSEQEE